MRMYLWAVIVLTFMTYAVGNIGIACYIKRIFVNGVDNYLYNREEMDNYLCAYYVYSYVRINGLNVSLFPPVHNYTNYHYFREQQTLLAVGPFGASPQSWLAAADNDNSRKVFARNLVSYLRSLDAFGALMEWGNLAATPDSRYDKRKFLLLLKAIQAEFIYDERQLRRRYLVLSVALPAVKKQIDTGYIVRELVNEADSITIQTLDMRTAANSRNVGLSAPLRSDPNAVGDDKYMSVEAITKYYISLGVPKYKIYIGMPTYGRTFKLANIYKTYIGAPAVGPGDQEWGFGPDGYISYGDTCQNILAGGDVVNVASQGARYYTEGSKWISYEDILSVTQKTCFAMKMGIGGIVFWYLDQDDYTGRGCLHGKHPLVTTAANLQTYSTLPSVCTTQNLTKFVDIQPRQDERPYIDRGPAVESVRYPMPMFCYYTNWSQYRRGIARFLPENIDSKLCTHIVYGYAVIKNRKIAPHIENDESTPWLEGMYARVTRIKRPDGYRKYVLIGLGGGTAGMTIWEDILNDGSRIDSFANYTVDFLREKNFHGLEITWQQPSLAKCSNFLKLLELLRYRFNNDGIWPRLLLALAMPAGKGNIDAHCTRPMTSINNYVDYLNLQTYDFHGNWDVITGHHSPLFPHRHEISFELEYNVNWAVNYYFSLGAMRSKMTLGIPTYGRTFTLRDLGVNNLKSHVVAPGKAGRFTAAPGLLSYYEVCEFLRNGATIVWSEDQRVPYAYNGTQWVGYEDYRSVLAKACYAKIYGLAGTNVRTLDYDDFTGKGCALGVYPLINTIFESGNVCNDHALVRQLTLSNPAVEVSGSNQLNIDTFLLWPVVSLFLI